MQLLTGKTVKEAGISLDLLEPAKFVFPASVEVELAVHVSLEI